MDTNDGMQPPETKKPKLETDSVMRSPEVKENHLNQFNMETTSSLNDLEETGPVLLHSHAKDSREIKSEEALSSRKSVVSVEEDFSDNIQVMASLEECVKASPKNESGLTVEECMLETTEGILREREECLQFSPEIEEGESMLNTQINQQIQRVETFLKMDRLRRKK